MVLFCSVETIFLGAFEDFVLLGAATIVEVTNVPAQLSRCLEILVF